MLYEDESSLAFFEQMILIGLLTCVCQNFLSLFWYRSFLVFFGDSSRRDRTGYIQLGTPFYNKLIRVRSCSYCIPPHLSSLSQTQSNLNRLLFHQQKSPQTLPPYTICRSLYIKSENQPRKHQSHLYPSQSFS